MTRNSAGALIQAWAAENGYYWSEFHPDWDDVEVEGALVRYSPDGSPYNALAGLWRDEEMAEVCTHGVSFYDGVATYTQDLIDRVAECNSPCMVYLVSNESDEDNHAKEQESRRSRYS